MQVNITAVNRTERVSKKTGKPFTSLGIKTQEHGERWLSGFANQDNAGWSAGTVAEINVEQKGEYLNFSTPKKEDKKDFSPSLIEIKNLINLQLMPYIKENNAILKEIAAQKGVDLSEIITTKTPYPEFNETNDASPL